MIIKDACGRSISGRTKVINRSTILNFKAMKTTIRIDDQIKTYFPQ